MSAIDMFKAAPPVSRTLAAATFITSVGVYTKILSGSLVIFHSSYLLRLLPQIWRLFTAFLITGPDLGIIFDTYFLYTYGSKLETASPRFTQPGDFFTYILFVCTVILGLNATITGGMVFTSALVLAFAYTSTQDDRGQKAQFFIVTIPAQWIPFAMLLMTFVMAGPSAAMVQGTGLVAAHLYDFLTRLWPEFGGGRNLLPTPGFIRRMWETKTATVQSKGFGTAFAPAQRSSATTSSSSGAGAGGVLPESWRSRGSGHRLGGE